MNKEGKLEKSKLKCEIKLGTDNYNKSIKDTKILLKNEIISYSKKYRNYKSNPESIFNKKLSY